MASSKNLRRIGFLGDDTVGSNKRLRQHENTSKGKEKVHYASTGESWECNTNLECTDTDTTRTSRGHTQMDRLARQQVQGIRKNVAFNKLGQPIGEAAVEMQSYIGVLTREKVKISYKNWKQVPNDVKELIWESINLIYNVDTNWKKGCLNSANNKWRQFKTHLTQTFIFSKLDKPEELNAPPAGYGITKDDWSSFVSSRMTDDFIKLSDQQKERRKYNIYPHRLARKGYARFAEEIADELCDDEEINRAIIWKKGRLTKEGNFEGEDLTKTADKIDAYIQKKREGKLKIEVTKHGILTKAPETEEHAGRVRGIGGHITAGRILKGPDVVKDVLNEHKKELSEAKKKISEQDACIKKLEAIVYKRGACDMSIDDEGICSVKLNHTYENDIKIDDDELQFVSKFDGLQGKQVALILESSGNTVAYGSIVCFNGQDKLIHGVPLPQNCMRVSIDEAVDKLSPLPVPIPNECETIGDAVGTHVAWPEHLIVKQDEKAERKKVEQSKKKHHLSASVPRSLHMLYCYSKRALDEGRYISMILDPDLFDEDYELFLHLEDIMQLHHLEPISGNCIVGYIWHLYKKLRKDNKIEKFRFVNPRSIPYVSKSTQDKMGKLNNLNQTASVLADRLRGASVDQLVFVPCNIGFHWILTVIEPYKEFIYLFDSLSHRIRDEDWKYVVEMALKLFNSNKGRKGRKNALRKVVKAPRQPDAKQCGYYVMRYMRHIIEEIATIERYSLRSVFTKSEYSREEIDEVRSELAECIQDHIYE